jgi:hypothetical protein
MVRNDLNIKWSDYPYLAPHKKALKAEFERYHRIININDLFDYVRFFILQEEDPNFVQKPYHFGVTINKDEELPTSTPKKKAGRPKKVIIKKDIDE